MPKQFWILESLIHRDIHSVTTCNSLCTNVLRHPNLGCELNFVFTKLFYLPRPDLGPAQPPIQWLPGLSRGKAAGAWRWLPTPSSTEVKERVGLHIYSPSGTSWLVLGWTLTFLSVLFYCIRRAEKYTGKIIQIITLILIRSSSCVLHFRLSACRIHFFRSCPHNAKGWSDLTVNTSKQLLFVKLLVKKFPSWIQTHYHYCLQNIPHWAPSTPHSHTYLLTPWSRVRLKKLTSKLSK
jgi:hypothetical protein